MAGRRTVRSTSSEILRRPASGVRVPWGGSVAGVSARRQRIPDSTRFHPSIFLVSPPDIPVRRQQLQGSEFFFFFFFLPDPMDSMVFRVRKQSTQNIETSRMPTSNEYSRTACTMTEHYTILILTKINHFGKHKRYPKNTLHVSFINGGHGTT